jgi:coenzyme F420-reducing hydrogenase gamma subunit
MRKKSNQARDKRAKIKPKLAVWKFASCDGCQLSLLDCEDELLGIAEIIEIANFAEASRHVLPGPYDLSLVEGSITTSHDADRIKDVRNQSRHLVTIGACATSGGVQALRNYAREEDYRKYVYAQPDYISALATSTPISSHVKVDFELQGCPINKTQLLEVISAFLHGRKPNINSYSECVDCKLDGNVCVMVAHGTPCLGPITHAGCGSICPRFNRGCYGCYGPQESSNPRALGNWMVAMKKASPDFVSRSLQTYYTGTKIFHEASEEFQKNGERAETLGEPESLVGRDTNREDTDRKDT